MVRGRHYIFAPLLIISEIKELIWVLAVNESWKEKYEKNDKMKRGSFFKYH
jgi:hypothetical protein